MGERFPSYSELLDSTRLASFLEHTGDYKSVVGNKWPVCEIKEGDWNYPLVNICFIENMLKNIVWCLASKYVPIVKVTSNDGINLWESLFLQPFSVDEKIAPMTNCPYKSAPVYFAVFPENKDINLMRKLYQTFVIPREDVRAYFDKEYETLLKGKRVLGVLCRGTDYIMTKPKGHPIQPSIEEVINLVRQKVVEMSVQYIYLATEEAAVVNMFNERFPGKVITNKRNYYDAYYDLYKGSETARISAVHFERENDSYYKSLEYLSSINLLSKCCGLIGGNCGGSRAALYLNDGKSYEYYHLFNLGLY